MCVKQRILYADCTVCPIAINLVAEEHMCSQFEEEDVRINLNTNTEWFSEEYNAVPLIALIEEKAEGRAVLCSLFSYNLAHLCRIKVYFCENIAYLKLLSIISTNSHTISFLGI